MADTDTTLRSSGIVLLRPHKTASSSLDHMLRAGYRDADICDVPFKSQIVSQGIRLEDYRYFWPHMTLPDFREMPGADSTDFRVVIPIREPQARFISAYNFFRHRGETNPAGRRHSVDQALIDVDLDPDVFRANPVLQRHFHNYQARFLFGHYSAHFFERAEIWLDRIPEADEVRAEVTRLIRIERVCFVDVPQARAVNADDLAGLDGLATAPTIRTSPNVRLSWPDLTDRQKAFVQDWSVLDQALYDAFVELSEDFTAQKSPH